MQLRYLEVLKHQEKLSDIKKGTRDGFGGCKTLNKVIPIYLEGKLEKAKFHWGLKRLKVVKNEPWLFLRMICSKQDTRNFFKGWQA